MGQQNPYDLLGVAQNANPDEIRSAYLKRTKVLHPDRFDRGAQPAEWQMANEMLQELNEAYNRVRTQAPDPVNGNGPFTQKPTSNTESSWIDLGKTQSYWIELGKIYLNAGTFSGVALTKDTFDPHLVSLNQYVATIFQAHLAIGNLNAVNVDPLVIEVATLLNNSFSQNSRLVTERIALLKRFKYFKEKNPFWKTFWKNLCSMEGSYKAGWAEIKADQVEITAINPRLIEIARQLDDLSNNIQDQVQVVAIQLVAQYGNAFQA